MFIWTMLFIVVNFISVIILFYKNKYKFYNFTINLYDYDDCINVFNIF